MRLQSLTLLILTKEISFEDEPSPFSALRGKVIIRVRWWHLQFVVGCLWGGLWVQLYS